jgi:hypothetical protein
MKRGLTISSSSRVILRSLYAMGVLLLRLEMSLCDFSAGGWDGTEESDQSICQMCNRNSLRKSMLEIQDSAEFG